MKKSLILTIIVVLFFLGLVLNIKPATGAEEKRNLDIEYPEFGGLKPETVEVSIPEYVKYIFNLLIGISGFVALVVLIMAGYQYLTSAGSSVKLQDAKEKIFSSLLGLIILFSSYLILTTINPQLIILHVAPLLPPMTASLEGGVYLCKELTPSIYSAWSLIIDFKDCEWKLQAGAAEGINCNVNKLKSLMKEIDEDLKKISKNCYVADNEGNIRSDFDNRVKYVYFVPGVDAEGYSLWYGAIFYEDRDFQDRSVPFYNHLTDPKPGRSQMEPYLISLLTYDSQGIRFSSVKPFYTQHIYHEDWKVTVYKKVNFNEGFQFEESWEAYKEYYLVQTWEGDVISGDFFAEVNLKEKQGWSPESIKIEGDLLVILLKEAPSGPRGTFRGSDSFFSKDDRNLLDNLNITRWVPCKSYMLSRPWPERIGQMCTEAAAEYMVILNAISY